MLLNNSIINRMQCNRHKYNKNTISLTVSYILHQTNQLPSVGIAIVVNTRHVMDLLYTLQPFFRFFQITGLCPLRFKSKSLYSLQPLQSKILLSLTILYIICQLTIIICAVQLSFVFPKIGFVKAIIHKLAYSINSFNACAILFNTFYRRDKYLRLVDKIQKLDETYLLHNPKWRLCKFKIRRQMLKFTIFTIVMSFLIKFVIEPMYCVEIEHIYRQTLLTTVGPYFIGIFGFLHAIFYLIIFTEYFASFDYFMRVQYFEEQNIQSMILIRNLYGEVYEMMCLFNGVFGFPILTWISAHFINLVANSYWCLNYYISNRSNFGAIVSKFVKFIRYEIFF